MSGLDIFAWIVLIIMLRGAGVKASPHKTQLFQKISSALGQKNGSVSANKDYLRRNN